MHLRRFVVVPIIVTGLLILDAANSFADPMLDLQINGKMAALKGIDGTYGWAFTTSSTLTIDGLGLWDHSPELLTEPHEVGLWTSTGTLITSAVVDNASLPVASADENGQWLFSPVTPFELAAGDYVLGAFYDLRGVTKKVPGEPEELEDPGDDLIVTSGLVTVSPVAPGVTYTGSAFVAGTALAFPTVEIEDSGRYFGPNLSVRSVQVPEPASVLLLGMGLAFVGIGRSRKRTTS